MFDDVNNCEFVDVQFTLVLLSHYSSLHVTSTIAAGDVQISHFTGPMSSITQ